jgi:hypothetical protein
MNTYRFECVVWVRGETLEGALKELHDEVDYHFGQDNNLIAYLKVIKAGYVKTGLQRVALTGKIQTASIHFNTLERFKPCKRKNFQHYARKSHTTRNSGLNVMQGSQPLQGLHTPLE